jgi:tetraacyldisaccharide 4'-kinase
MREPAFWWNSPGLTSGLLSPLAAVYGAVAAARMARPAQDAGIPVICVGNPTLGGAGKTPAAITISKILVAAGRRPFLLSRGYGGRLAGPIVVDAAHHRAADVGDEPLLLARAAPTIVSRDRVAGAAAARAAGAGVVVMDDGFQSPGLRKDRSILVVDGRRGIGNGRVFPAGPLRAPLQMQLSRAQALLVIGPGAAGEQVAAVAQAQRLAVFHGRLVPDAAALAALKGEPVLAFAGIGDPEKFFGTLREQGIDVRAAVGFADHHRYRRSEALGLIGRAEREGLVLVTTEKDWARLTRQPDVAALSDVARTLSVALQVSEDAAFREWVLG